MSKAKIIKSTLEHCHAEIEVGGSIFNLRNIYEESTGFTHIEIYDERGEFVDEFASGFGVDLEDDDETLADKSRQISEYISHNLIF